MRLNYGKTIFKLVAFLRKFIEIYLLLRYLSMRIPIINDTIYDPKGCILSSKLPSITFAIFYKTQRNIAQNRAYSYSIARNGAYLTVYLWKL